MLPADFIAIFPEFSNTAQYSSARITFWLGIAAQFVDPTRWSTLTNQGTALLTAHYLVLDQDAQMKAANQLNSPASELGGIDGLETAKAVDGVSVSMDVANVTMAGAGYYNRTSYGVQYWQMARMMGAGGLQVSM